MKHLSWGTKCSNLSYSNHSECPVKKRAQDELEGYREGKNMAKELLPDGSTFKGGKKPWYILEKGICITEKNKESDLSNGITSNLT